MRGRVRKLEDDTFIVVYYKECTEDSEAVISVSCKLMPGFSPFKDGDNIEFELVELVTDDDGNFSNYAMPIIKINPHIAKIIDTKKESKMKVVLSEHCFGSNAYVNGIDITETEEGLFDPVAQKDVRGAILLEIMQNMDNIPAYYWNELAQMAVQNNPRYEINEEESYHDTCEQCGNWNSSTEYNKK
jgi:hypothetical protein